MKNIPPALLAHYAQDVTTLAHLWQITRVDGVVLRGTDHDQDILYAGDVYTAVAGFTPTAIQTTADLAVDNLDVDGMLSAGFITHEEVRKGALDKAEIKISRCNYANPGMGIEKMRMGWVGEVKLTRDGYTAEIRGLFQLLQQSQGRLLTPECGTDLGSSKCKIDLALFTASGTVNTVDTNGRAFTDPSVLDADGWYTGGVLTWTGGVNSGRRIEVKGFALGGVFELHEAFDISPGDTYSVHAGCDKTRATCKAKFSNVLNFRGFPDIPGQDFQASNRIQKQPAASGGGKGDGK